MIINKSGWDKKNKESIRESNRIINKDIKIARWIESKIKLDKARKKEEKENMK